MTAAPTPTPGPVEIVSDAELGALVIRSIPGPPEPDCLSGEICIVEIQKGQHHPSAQRHAADAELIADAFNVRQETGRTPTELRNSHDALVAALNEADNHLFLLRAALKGEPIDQSDFPRSLNLNDRETLAKAARVIAAALKAAKGEA